MLNFAEAGQPDPPLQRELSAHHELAVQHELAVRAVACLNSAAGFSAAGLRELLVLRAIATSVRRGGSAMIALLRPDDSSGDLLRFSRMYRNAASRARAGVVPTIDLLADLIGPVAQPTASQAATRKPVGTSSEQSAAATLQATAQAAARIGSLVREPATRLPVVLKSALATSAILREFGAGASAHASLACSLLLCVGGATADAWLPIPAHGLASGQADPESTGPVLQVLGTIAREAQAMEVGLAKARALQAEDESRVRTAYKRAAWSALDMLALLSRNLTLTIPDAARALGQTIPTSGAAVARLARLGIVREVTGRRRSRCFVYGAVIDALAPDEAR